MSMGQGSGKEKQIVQQVNLAQIQQDLVANNIKDLVNLRIGEQQDNIVHILLANYITSAPLPPARSNKKASSTVNVEKLCGLFLQQWSLAALFLEKNKDGETPLEKLATLNTDLNQHQQKIKTIVDALVKQSQSESCQISLNQLAETLFFTVFLTFQIGDKNNSGVLLTIFQQNEALTNALTNSLIENKDNKQYLAQLVKSVLQTTESPLSNQLFGIELALVEQEWLLSQPSLTIIDDKAKSNLNSKVAAKPKQLPLSLKQLNDIGWLSPELITPEIRSDILLVAMRQGDDDFVKCLLQTGTIAIAKADYQDQELISPLHYAISIGKLEWVRALLNNGTDANLARSDKNSPVQLAEHLAKKSAKGKEKEDKGKEKEGTVSIPNDNSNDMVKLLKAFGAISAEEITVLAEQPKQSNIVSEFERIILTEQDALTLCQILGENNCLDAHIKNIDIIFAKQPVYDKENLSLFDYAVKYNQIETVEYLIQRTQQCPYQLCCPLAVTFDNLKDGDLFKLLVKSGYRLQEQDLPIIETKLSQGDDMICRCLEALYFYFRYLKIEKNISVQEDISEEGSELLQLNAKILNLLLAKQDLLDSNCSRISEYMIDLLKYAVYVVDYGCDVNDNHQNILVSVAERILHKENIVHYTKHFFLPVTFHVKPLKGKTNLGNDQFQVISSAIADVLDYLMSQPDVYPTETAKNLFRALLGCCHVLPVLRAVSFLRQLLSHANPTWLQEALRHDSNNNSLRGLFEAIHSHSDQRQQRVISILLSQHSLAELQSIELARFFNQLGNITQIFKLHYEDSYISTYMFCVESAIKSLPDNVKQPQNPMSPYSMFQFQLDFTQFLDRLNNPIFIRPQFNFDKRIKPYSFCDNTPLTDLAERLVLIKRLYQIVTLGMYNSESVKKKNEEITQITKKSNETFETMQAKLITELKTLILSSSVQDEGILQQVINVLSILAHLPQCDMHRNSHFARFIDKFDINEKEEKSEQYRSAPLLLFLISLGKCCAMSGIS